MTRPIRTPRARSMLLRIWEERSEHPPHRAIRLSLECPTGKRKGFDSPAALTRYLDDLIASMEPEADTEAAAPRA